MGNVGHFRTSARSHVRSTLHCSPRMYCLTTSAGFIRDELVRVIPENICLPHTGSLNIHHLFPTSSKPHPILAHKESKLSRVANVQTTPDPSTNDPMTANNTTCTHRRPPRGASKRIQRTACHTFRKTPHTSSIIDQLCTYSKYNVNFDDIAHVERDLYYLVP